MADLEPITRKEQYLAKAAGQDVTTPEPVTREEMYLDAIAKGGGGGGGNALVELKLSYYYDELEQLYVFDIIGNDEGDHVTGETIIQYVKNGQIPYVMFPVSDGNGHPDDTIKVPNIFSGIEEQSDGMGGIRYEFYFSAVSFNCSSLDYYPIRTTWEF